jgi:hypothetical protein
MAADRQQPSQDDILEAALAALPEDEIPPDEDYLGWPDPDSAPPRELADLTTPQLNELIAAQPAPAAEIGPAGFWPRDRSGGGCGFADGGELDVLGPGVPLAGFADDAHARLAALTDDELIGVLRAWRRQTSWAQARELAAVAELARRRPAEGSPPAAAPGALPAKLSEFIADEVAMALTLTGRAAVAELDLALLNGQATDLPPASLLPPDLVPPEPVPGRSGPGTGPAADRGGQDGTRAPGPGASPLAAGSRCPASGARPAAGSTSRPGCAAPARAARRRPPG